MTEQEFCSIFPHFEFRLIIYSEWPRQRGRLALSRQVVIRHYEPLAFV